MRRPTALTIAVAPVWGLVAYLAPPFGMLAGVICLFCAFVDMGMNGAQGADYAPVNVAAASIAFVAAAIGMPS